MKSDIIIIGAGPAGLGAAHSLRKNGKASLILEKDYTYGGLMGNFTIANGYRFDRFVHFSFSQIDEVNEIFNKSTEGEIIRHIPNPFNIYKGKWIKHPAQNNLYPLEEKEKNEIIEDFMRRPDISDISEVKNYEEWLRIQFGNTFAERFPMEYTKKYWMCEARDLETKWVGRRIYQPSLEEVLQGAKTSETPVTYYAKEMRYPKYGGYKQYLKSIAENADIAYGEEVEYINPTEKKIKTSSGKEYEYQRLISSMPLPKLIKAIGNDVPERIKKAAKDLKYTSGYQISIALRNNNIPPYLWFYIYDKEILAARVYSPSLKSPDNVPTGCSSLQLEIYCNEDEYSREQLIEKSVKPLIELGVIREEDIVEIDVRFEPFANIIFDQKIYDNREQVIEYVKSIGIEPIGRFGLWDYLWSDQALKSGLDVCKC